MELLITFIIAAVVGFVVYIVMGLVPPLAKYADAGGLLTFLLVILSRLGVF